MGACENPGKAPPPLSPPSPRPVSTAGTQHIHRAPVTGVGWGGNQPALEFHSPAGLGHIKHPVLTPEAGASRTAFPAPGTRGSGTGRHLELSRQCDSRHGSPGSHTHIRDQVWGQGWREGSGGPRCSEGQQVPIWACPGATGPTSVGTSQRL